MNGAERLLRSAGTARRIRANEDWAAFFTQDPPSYEHEGRAWLDDVVDRGFNWEIVDSDVESVTGYI